jgi:hypothetical protein
MGIIERQVYQKKATKLKILEQLKRKEQDEVEGCTFHPALYSSKYDNINNYSYGM